MQESFVIWDRCRNARLLEHDLRKPDAIRILGMPPWQVTLKLTEPPEQLFAKCDEITTVQHSAGTFSHSSLRLVWSEAKS
jgi:hypothetical protein